MVNFVLYQSIIKLQYTMLTVRILSNEKQNKASSRAKDNVKGSGGGDP